MTRRRCDRRNGLLRPHFEARLGNDIPPHVDQLLLEELAESEPAVPRHLHRCRHHDLLPREVPDRAADIFFLDRRRPQPVMQAVYRCRETGRTTSNDQYIEQAGRRLGQLCDPLDTLASLLEGVPDEPHPSQLPDDIEPWHVGLEVPFDVRNVHAALRRAEDELDGLRRTRPGAEPVPNAPCRADRDGLPVAESQDMDFDNKGKAIFVNYDQVSKDYLEGTSTGRTLEEYYALRQYPGSPPLIPNNGEPKS